MPTHGPPPRAEEPERLAFAGQGVRWPAISRQGRLAYARLLWDADIWRLELTGSHRVDNLPVNSTRLDHEPRYSPDGKRIAFGSDRSGDHEIWVCDADGSNAVKLTSFAGPFVSSPAWSPDGHRIAFGAQPGGISEIYLVSADGGKPEPLRSGQSDDELSSWSRDGKWIYVGSKRSGQDQVWKVPAGGGEAVQVTKKGGSYAAESPDGGFLYYLRSWETEENTELWRVPVEGGEETRIIASVCSQFFAVVERGIYFLSGWENPSVQFFHFATGKIETVARLEGSVAFGLSVSPDGRWLLYSKHEGRGSDLMLVENFR
jgi:Tol biopolymer transport system component